MSGPAKHNFTPSGTGVSSHCIHCGKGLSHPIHSETPRRGFDEIAEGDYAILDELRSVLGLETKTDSPYTVLVFAVARIKRHQQELETYKKLKDGIK